MSLFKKPKKNLSLKSARATDDDSAEVEVPNLKTGSTEINAINEKSSAITKPSAVSFAEENEETSEFQVKKSDRSIRVVQQFKKESVKSHQTKGQLIAQSKKSTNRNDVDADVILVGEEAAKLGESMSDSADNAPASISESLSHIMKRGDIPDANMIHLIRKKRQLLRDTGIAHGEPALGNVGVPLPVENRREDKSALVREDDEADKSDASDQEAIGDGDGILKMSVRQRQEDQRQKLRSSFLSAEQGSDEEEDDHLREWEKQQISKGVSTLTVVDKQHLLLPNSGNTIRMTASNNSRKPKTIEKVSVSQVKDELVQHLSELKESHRRHKFERQARADSYEYSLEEIKKAENISAKLDQVYVFYQELLAYVADFIDCYNTKMPSIMGLEERLLTAHQQKADRLRKRRRQDVVDQSVETAPTKPGQAVFTPDDEMRARIADRTNRRSRRRWKRQENNIRDHYEGWSTDDEEANSENVRLGVERDAVQKQAVEILSEICDEFVQLESIISRFEDWRTESGESYRAAFGGLCLSKLLCPLVRLHILNWNPLEESAIKIQDHHWFKALASYCCVSPDNCEQNNDELSILPGLVEKVIVTKITSIVSRVWDPLSLTQTKRIADLLETIASIFPTLNGDSKQVRDLILAVKMRFNEALDNDVFMPLTTKQALADRSSQLAAFFYRQLWTCVKLFVSMSRFSSLLASGPLQDLMITGLLNRYIALGLMQLEDVTPEVIELYTTLMTAVPGIWFSQLPPSRITTIDKMKPFSTMLFQLVGRFSAQSTDPASRGALKMFATSVSEFFISIRANDMSSRIVSELGIQL